jgi:hypothetical protein
MSESDEGQSEPGCLVLSLQAPSTTQHIFIEARVVALSSIVKINSFSTWHTYNGVRTENEGSLR